MKSNEGIIVKGGSLSAENLAVGKSASINVNSVEKNKDLIRRVEALLVVLEEEKNNIPNHDEVKRAGQTVKDEVQKEKPDPGILSVLLSLISSSVPPIATITKAVKAVKEAVEVFNE
jgi:hypothetical protein